MVIGIDKIIYFLLFIVLIDIVLGFRVFINKINIDRYQAKSQKLFRAFLNLYKDDLNLLNKPVKKLIENIEQFIILRDTASFDRKRTKDIIENMYTPAVENYYIKRLRSKRKYVRIHASKYLSYNISEKTTKALEFALTKEPNIVVKLYLANALATIKNNHSIPVLVETLKNAPIWYRDKVNIIISEFGSGLLEHLPRYFKDETIEIKELIVDFSATYMSEDLKDYLLRIVDTCELEKLLIKALNILEDMYYSELDKDKYLHNANITIKNSAIRALSKIATLETIEKLVSFLGNAQTDKHVEVSITKIIKTTPGFIFYLMDTFNKTNNENIKSSLAEVLSNRIEYLILMLSSKDKQIAHAVIKKIMQMGKNSAVIGFLNRNVDIEVENEILDILKEVTNNDVKIAKEYCTYLNEKMLKKCNLLKCERFEQKKEEKRTKGVIGMLYSLLIFLLLIFPLIYIFRHFDQIVNKTIFDNIKTYVRDFNYYLVFYSTTINMIYLILLIISFHGVLKQSKYWKLKSMDFVFKKRMLPSISVIAPAFNEELTIIENVNSLLNLRYPEYELLIINDGSKDKTLNTLINNFELERIDFVIDTKIVTMPIRGVYSNKAYPKLIVIDKENGGKADSLNAGINISKNEYFCGIDADSILEGDALLKLASLTMDSQIENVALGGNIFPVNGCTIRKGFIEKKAIPQNSYARFQTIEYMRAFMSGRIAWANMNCLLIISGAFGLFKKNRVIEIGGYLTSSGKYGKDTVGEDMELVVRLSRYLFEQKEKFKVNYAYNANCWTEVPESLGMLIRQRDRWHRGLIDILTYHKKMIFNSKYREVGLIAFPYFFIFEMIGPLIEIQGYLMVIFGAFIGLLNFHIALLLFVSTILFGTLISLGSLLLVEKDMNYFTKKEILILIAYAIIENFGYRQLVSFWRVAGYISALRKPKGWGEMQRKGFVDNNVRLDCEGVQ